MRITTEGQSQESRTKATTKPIRRMFKKDNNVAGGGKQRHQHLASGPPKLDIKTKNSGGFNGGDDDCYGGSCLYERKKIFI